MEIIFSNIIHKDGTIRSYVERFPDDMMEWKHLFTFLHKKTKIPLRYMTLRCGNTRISWLKKKYADPLQNYIEERRLTDVGSMLVSLSTFVNADQYVFDEQVSLYNRLTRKRMKQQLLYHMKQYSSAILHPRNPIIPKYNDFFHSVSQ